MSREERRQRERLMRNMERGPALPPAARARAERNAARRANRAGAVKRRGAFTAGFWIRTVLVTAALGFIAFSLQWGSGMPVSLYVGMATSGVVLALLVGFRLLQRRSSAS